MSKKKIWNAKLQMHYPEITEAALSPDGTKIVYAVKEPLMTKDESVFITHLFLVPVSGGTPVQLTYGEYTNHAVKWSPDSQYISFLSNRSGKNNIYILRCDGGEAWALTDYKKTDIVYHVWAPDSKSLAFLMPTPPSYKKKKALRRRDDSELWDKDYDFAHVYWVPLQVGGLKTPKSKKITTGRFHVFGMAWMPKGDALAIIHQPTPLADTWPQSYLAVIPIGMPGQSTPIKKGDIPNIAKVSLWGGHPHPSPGGAWIACTTADSPLSWAGANHVVLYSPDGNNIQSLSHTPDGQSWIIGWSDDGKSVIVGELNGVDTHIYGLPVTGESPFPILCSDSFKCAMHTNGTGCIVYAEEGFRKPNDLRLLNTKSQADYSITSPALPPSWGSELPSVEMLNWEVEDGLQIEGIVIYPLNYLPGERYPLIVEVHGGPMGVFNRRYLGWPGRYCDVLSAAESGFVVLRVNPRGSSGYGRAFRLANYEDWGYGDFADIMAGVDLLIDKGLVDPNRMGMMGWSYGGYMTSWTITQTNRFIAACVGAGVTNLMSFNGTSDIPGFIPDYFKTEFWDDLQPYQRHSPMFNVKDVTTPTLIQHGSIDERVPLEQGLQLYNALKHQKVPVEMVIYPRQHHGIAEPRLRIDMRKRPIEWFSKWLLDN